MFHLNAVQIAIALEIVVGSASVFMAGTIYAKAIAKLALIP